MECGKRSAGLAPLVARHPFPEEWRLVITLPPRSNLSLPERGEGMWGVAGLHGRGEEEAFTRLRTDSSDLQRTEALCRLVLMGVLPAFSNGT